MGSFARFRTSPHRSNGFVRTVSDSRLPRSMGSFARLGPRPLESMGSFARSRDSATMLNGFGRAVSTRGGIRRETTGPRRVRDCTHNCLDSIHPSQRASLPPAMQSRTTSNINRWMLYASSPRVSNQVCNQNHLGPIAWIYGQPHCQRGYSLF
jgi:hypothetical protein